MTCSVKQLIEDVLSRLGEYSSSSSAGPLAGIPTMADTLERKLRSLLPETGGRLISEAPVDKLSGAESYEASITARMTDCGLFAFDIPLPDDFAGLVSAGMKSWKRNVSRLVMIDSDSHEWQWSKEPAVAGCPSRPMAYLNYGYGGFTLTLIGSESEEDTLGHLYLWRIPLIDDEGFFKFPSPLYSALVSSLAASL